MSTFGKARQGTVIRIGMLGADSTHTEAYARLMAPGGPFADRARVVKLWGEDRAQARHKAEQCDIMEVVEHPADAVSGVDAVMVVHRYGDDHPAARLALQARLPTFVDKPFTNDLTSARTLVETAREQGIPLMSCSALRYAPEVQAAQTELARLGGPRLVTATGPAAGAFPDPRARHPFFYCVHAVEMLHTLAGPGAVAVTTHRTPAVDVAVVTYADDRRGVVNLLRSSPPVYHAQVYAEQGAARVAIQDHAAYYRETLARILTMFETGEPPFPIDWALEVMAILTAIDRSVAEGGRTVPLSELS